MKEQFFSFSIHGPRFRLSCSEQRAAAADIPANQLGTQYLPGQAQLQRPGERNIQEQRVGTGTERESTFPRGMGGLDLLGSQLATGTGGGRNMPSGQRVN